MATARSFNDMLNEYLHYKLLMEEFTKKDYFFGKLKSKGLIDEGWKGGTIPVPFKGAIASSVKYGSLVDLADINEYDFVRGEVTAQKEVWGAMMWHSRDLREHNGRIPEDSFIKNLPGQIDEFIDYMKQVVSIGLLNGGHLTKLTAAANANTGTITVANPERLILGQKLTVTDDSVTKTGYVKSINMNAKTAVLVTAKGGSTPIDFSSANTVASTGKVFVEGADSSGFTGLPAQLLSATNGGTTNIFGVAKTDYPYTQCLNISGSGISSSNILEKLFDAQNQARQIGKGNPTDLLMSYKHLGNAIKSLESGSGAYRHVETKVSPYGYTEITLGSVKGNMTLVGINEKDDDTIIGMDWNTVKFHTNEGFKKEVDPDGNQYYKVRNSTGYQYVVDVGMYGELVVSKPSHNFIIHSVP